jgi:hypothetical protein
VRRLLVARALAVALLLVAGCTSEQERTQVAKEEIRTVLADGYLPRLAEIYGGANPQILEGWAAQKEISGIAKRVQELAQEGRSLQPELRAVTLEEVNVWSHSNAYVTTLEEWDLRVYNTGTRALLSEELGQHDRVKYQLKRTDTGAWIVLFRSRVE